MRVLIAFDKFRDALSAEEACAIAARALAELPGNWSFDLCPLTDGGEGFARVLTLAAGGTLRSTQVTGPRRKMKVSAAFGLAQVGKIPPLAREALGWSRLSPSATIAVVELASASGLALLAPNERDPWVTSTIGTGELIAAAAREGVADILLGIGGSATNDLGLGALAALGCRFASAEGGEIAWPAPATWDELQRISAASIRPLPPLRIACDVTNPLLGPCGCTTVFAPQKGLRAGDGPRMEAAVARMADLLGRQFHQPANLADRAGAGAAGGTAFGLMNALEATLVPGSAVVAAWLELDERIRAADLVLTGEGRFDETSLTGKGAGAILARAASRGKPVHVFAGQVAPSQQLRPGFHAITPPGLPLAQALAVAPTLLAESIQRHLASTGYDDAEIPTRRA